MRKLLILSVALVVTLCGCSKEDSNTANTNDQQQVAAVEAAAPAATEQQAQPSQEQPAPVDNNQPKA